MKGTLRRWHCLVGPTLVLALACAPVRAASRSVPDADPSIVGSRQDPAVARAVAEAASAPARVDRMPARATTTAFDSLATAPRRCSAIESATRLALVAACIRSEHCSPSPTGTAPACYIVKVNAK